MKKNFHTLLTFGLFLNLYITLTFFWNLSNSVYQTNNVISFLVNAVPFILSLLLLIRHAQIIELTFTISKQFDYMLAILGLTLPLITVLLEKNISIYLIGYLLASLMLYEIFLLRSKGAKIYRFGKLIIACIWLIWLLYEKNNLDNSNVIIANLFPMSFYIIVSIVISIELYTTCITVPLHVSDKYDLYMLAYFSVAGVLFNYCSENIARSKLPSLYGSSIQFSEIVLFIFWVVVLVRIIQSLHLAALDYHDIQLKGLDLAILSTFYMFITTYWLLKPEQTLLYGILFILASITSGYFYYMRSRIKNETAINLNTDKRIQTVNSLVFATVAISNGYMFFNGYSYSLFILQIIALLFNIYHSHILTMWIKFDLLYRDQNDRISFIAADKNDSPKVAAIINRNFGYIYEYYFNTINRKKQTRRLIHLLISSGSKYGSFGMSHFYWVLDKETNENVGLVCLRSKYNVCTLYTVISFILFIMKYYAYMGLRSGSSGLIRIIRNREQLTQLDLSDEDDSIELAYVVIDKHKRRHGYMGKVISALRNINIKNNKLYPKKNLDLRNISLVVRKTNNIAISVFKKNGFIMQNEIHNIDFDYFAQKGCALKMQCNITTESVNK